ncbi:GntR family transcriptional regulator [Microvirga roseola]|uniref:GntR family transcriptional regulator n=1 Tax=Microvirga roseola TaxID=2883126 RepID=UPI001E2C5E46|nr:GntR family transcriptional regulator [Microvirga roseola]
MAGKPTLGFRPLYRQVRDILVKRIADGVWQAGQMLPSEPEIAAELDVSPGTVRKALDEMTAENLVVRRQGRGTFVAKHDDARILFQFFKLIPDSSVREFPDSKVLNLTSGINPEAASQLGLGRRDCVLVLDRIRTLAGQACVLERICLPAALFPGLEKREVPNNLYQLYAMEFGVTIGHASEKLKAVAATGEEAQHLGVAVGEPLLRVDRLAFSLDQRPVEWRVSLCRTDQAHYISDLR